MHIDLIAGARPNFMKIAPIIDAIKANAESAANLSFRLVHTGQHYDANMSGSFFEQLGIPEPDINLGAGGGTQAEQARRHEVKPGITGWAQVNGRNAMACLTIPRRRYPCLAPVCDSTGTGETGLWPGCVH